MLLLLKCTRAECKSGRIHITDKCIRPLYYKYRTLKSGRTGHILCATHGRLHHAMTIRTLRDMDGFSIIRGYGVMHQFLTALSASHASNTHTANLTGINRHVVLQTVEKRVTAPLFLERNRSLPQSPIRMKNVSGPFMLPLC